ncbi:exosome complex protein Rrp42 [Candidatus Pacearchaeota archaeon]|nr:exosome complex protein Rrp42 [Candidatus Pacearchaeota archaeon]
MIEESNLTAKRIHEYLEHGNRFDKRNTEEYREIEVKCGISKKSEGSAKVKIGKTEVWVGVKMEVAEPYPDSPDKGNLMVTAELTPLSHPKYEYGPPKFDAIELGRLVDRGIRESKYIDLNKLCIEKGEKVWQIFVDVYSINDDGNLLDAAFIASVAALKDAKIPFYDKKEEKIDYKKPSKEKLPLTENEPFNFSIYLIGDKIILDPIQDEENASDGRLVLTVIPTKPISICSMQKSGEFEISEEKFSEMLDVVEKTYKTLFPKIQKLAESSVKSSKQ